MERCESAASPQQDASQVSADFTFARLMLATMVLVILSLVMRKFRPQKQARLQMMCPACGLITPRRGATCLECGKPLAKA